MWLACGVLGTVGVCVWFMSRKYSATATTANPHQNSNPAIADTMPHVEISDIAPASIDFIALDVETANRGRHSICQLGIAVVTQDGVIQYGTLIDPEEAFDPQNIMIHGIEESDVHGAPLLESVIEALRPLLEGQIVVGHSSFDKSAFNAAYAAYEIAPLDCEWRDSINAAKKAWPNSPNYKLKTLAASLSLELDHHDALSDAKVAAQVVIKAAEETSLSYPALLQPKAAKRYTKASPPSPAQDGPLSGEVVCFSGHCSLSRKDAFALAAASGMEVKTSVSKKVTLLVVGAQDPSALAGHDKSTKHRRAEELISQGHYLRILSEAEFMALISDP